MEKVKTVDEHIAKAPEEMQGKLRELRVILQKAAPQAEEKISYSMPYYHYKGRLAYFAYAKHHIGLYLLPPVLEKHTDDLKEFVTTKSAIHFPLNAEFPVTFIKRLIATGIQHNEAKK